MGQGEIGQVDVKVKCQKDAMHCHYQQKQFKIKELTCKEVSLGKMTWIAECVN